MSHPIPEGQRIVSSNPEVRLFLRRKIREEMPCRIVSLISPRAYICVCTDSIETTGETLLMLFQAVTGAMSIWIMDNLEVGQIKKIKKCTVGFTLCAALVTLMVMLFGPEVIWILGGQKYQAAVTLLPGMAMAVYLQMLTNLLTIILTYDKNLTKTAVVTGVIAVGSIGMKLWLLPIKGISVLPGVNILTFALVFTFTYLILVRTGYGKCFNGKLTFGTCGILFGITCVCPYLYSMIAVRYSVLGIMLLVCCTGAYYKRNLWLPIVRKKLFRKR